MYWYTRLSDSAANQGPDQWHYAKSIHGNSSWTQSVWGVDQGYSRVQAARSLDINANTLGRWLKEAEDSDGQAFRGNGNATQEQEQIRDLQSQVRRLEMEKAIFKHYCYRLC